MTKTRGILLGLILVITFAVIFFRYTSNQPLSESIQETTNPERPVNGHQINGRTVLGLAPGTDTKILKDLKIRNTVSGDWAEKLEESLRTQGGEAVKEVEVKKVASLIWLQNDTGLNVESVKITIKNKTGEEILFRALVDSQNGKILETWDRPVIDPINPKKNFRLKIDPRYFNQ